MYFCISVFLYLGTYARLFSWVAVAGTRPNLLQQFPERLPARLRAPPGNLHKFISHQIHKYRSTEEGKYKGQLSSVIEFQPLDQLPTAHSDYFKSEAVMATCGKSCSLTVFVEKIGPIRMNVK